MALDRWIALVLLGVCLAYGYAAWFTMDANLAPFMKRNPIWPSTFPKILSVIGLVLSLIILSSPKPNEVEKLDIDYRRLGEYKIGQAIALLGLMVLYTLCLSSLGFILSTVAFLFLGSFILGERRWLLMLAVTLMAALSIWYLVQEVLGIYMRPLPNFLSSLLGG